MEFMFSQRGQRLIIKEGFKYYREYETQEGWKWRCIKRNCKAKLYLTEDSSVILKSELEHSHEAEENLARQVISNNAKRKATEEISERPMKVVRKEISMAPLQHSANINAKDIEYIRKSVYRARRKTLPPLPKCIKDVHAALDSLKVESYQGEEMVQINDEEKNMVCFSTKSNLTQLCEKKKMFVDGTFSYCPKYFCQMFTIHTAENGNYIPLAFCLLPSKQISSYESAFRSIKKLCEEMGLNFHPDTVVSDFEMSVHIAVKNVWPSCEIVGCRFHLTQSWWRRIQTLNLSSEYKDNKSEIGHWLRLVLGLTFLDPVDVADSFVEDLMAIQPNDSRVRQFSDYLTDTYISDESKFPPYLWACPSTDAERTTNACESFHSRFNSNFNKAHPNIFTFAEVIKQIQVDVYALRNSINQPKKITNLKYKKRKEKIDSFLDKYKKKEITTMDFLKCVAYFYEKRKINEL